MVFLAFFVSVVQAGSSDGVRLTASGPGDEEDEGLPGVKWYFDVWSHGCFIYRRLFEPAFIPGLFDRIQPHISWTSHIDLSTVTNS